MNSEIMQQIEELKKCAEKILRISEVLQNLQTPLQEEKKAAELPEEKEPEKEITLEEVRAVLAEKSRAGFTKEVRELLKKHGADRLSKVNPSEYKSLLEEGKVL